MTPKAGQEFPITQEMRVACGSISGCSCAEFIRLSKVAPKDSGEGYYLAYEILDRTKQRLDTCSGCVEIKHLTKLTKTGMLSLKEKFAVAFKGEPEKSFIKAGIMNLDESLTSDGESLFMAYLLKKNGPDFKTTVVDPILEADKKEQAV